MIIGGGSRASAAFFAQHLVRTDENERVSFIESRGLIAQDVRDAFQEMAAVASGAQCKNWFYHANINTRADEHLTAEQWELAADRLEQELGLEGQPRFVVEHEKAGRIHRHILWSRIDLDTMTARRDSHNYRKHEIVARELERLFGHERVQGAHAERDGVERPERRPQNWETFRGHGSGLSPDEVKAEITGLWQEADSGRAFAAALDEAGYILARGDRRDFVVIDQAAEDHSLTRRISGAKAAEIRARMADVDRDALPSVADARELARARLDQAESGSAPTPDIEAELARQFGPEPKLSERDEADVAARFGDWVEAPRGVPADWQKASSGVPQDWQAAARGESADTGEEHTAWERFANRVRAFHAQLAAFWHDEFSGTPQAERGLLARVFDAGRRLIGGWRTGNGAELAEGIKEAQALAEPLPDIIADEGGGGAGDTTGEREKVTGRTLAADEAATPAPDIPTEQETPALWMEREKERRANGEERDAEQGRARPADTFLSDAMLAAWLSDEPDDAGPQEELQPETDSPEPDFGPDID